MKSRPLPLAVSAAILFVVFRSFPLLWYEAYQFDSDQAVLGLMAKHLSELRTFPLFVYGQHYILGIQAWLAAPLFAVGEPTIFFLRLPLVLVNAAIAALLIVLLVRDVGLRPFQAFAAALPFTLPTPVVSSELLYTLGYSAEPLLYALLLWVLRTRPIAFGIVLIVGFLHREFTAYAVPALALVMALEGTLFTRATLERALTVVVVCAVGWVGVEVAKSRVDVLGPASGAVENAPLSVQMDVISSQVCVDAATLPARARSLLDDALPALFGTKRVSMAGFGINTPAWTGWPLLSWLLPATVLLMILRIRKPDLGPPAFCLYLAVVGSMAALAYPLACAVTPGFPAVIRYILMALFVPIAIAAAYLRREPVGTLRGLAVAALVAWAGLNGFDNVTAVRAFKTSTEPDHRRALADYLVTHGITYARADYWDAYITDFLTRERVTVASTGKVRVREYELAVESHAQETVTITRTPCATADTAFGMWCIRGPKTE